MTEYKCKVYVIEPQIDLISSTGIANVIVEMKKT